MKQANPLYFRHSDELIKLIGNFFVIYSIYKQQVVRFMRLNKPQKLKQLNYEKIIKSTTII